MNSSILCSVIIPTYNREDDLRRCLDSVAAQNTTNFEVIVVDDCSQSEDLVRNIVDVVARQNPNISFLCIRQKENGGHGKARNAGAQIARGTIILFTDDDCTVPANWVAGHIDAHARYPTAAGVGGWYWPPPKSKINRFDRFYELQYEVTYPQMRDCEVWTNTMYSPAGNTANMSYKTEIFRSLKGFDERIYFSGGIDWELKTRCIALNHSLVSIPLSVQHERLFTLSSFISKSIKLGRGRDYMARKFPSLPSPSLYGALGTFATWRGHNIIRGEGAWMALLWELSLILGKYVNRVARFYPTEVYHMRSLSYFTYRIRNGIRIKTHELLPFDPVHPNVHQISNEPTNGSAKILYSVVIPTFNRKSLLIGACRAVLNQLYVPAQLCELIISDDGSTDGTKEAIEELQREYPDRVIRYNFQNNQGAAGARNTGARLARGEFIFFTDSDCRVQKDWMWRMIEAYKAHPEIVGTGGGMLTRLKEATLFDTQRNRFSDNRFVTLYPTTIVISNDTTNGILAFDTASMSIRTSAFHKVGGFYILGIPGIGQYHEDVEFAFRVQHEVGPMALVPKSFSYNQRLLTLRGFRAISFIRGATLHKLVERISPEGISVCQAPLRSQLIVMFIQSLLHPMDRVGWVNLINVQSYTAGYRAGLSGVAKKYAHRDPET